ncbi:MAG: hypothetical protein HY815_29055 [Candidatus Riflebacteria bacterium]|nr:hypothetical protein [Candidatus Riflebacteria bacterium]
MVALGTLVSGVAHEINNPNNFIMLNTPVLHDVFESIRPILEEYHENHGDFLMGGMPYAQMRENVPVLFSWIVEGAKRIKNIVEGLKSFARTDSPDLTQSVDVNAVVKSALLLVNNQIKRATNSFAVHYGDDLPPVRGNFQRLEQVVINLLQNACEALPDRRKGIWVTTSYDRSARLVVVEVRDRGVGIPADRLPHIIDPFYTTKRQRGGTGLGLSVSSGIVRDHGGTLGETAPLPGTAAHAERDRAAPGRGGAHARRR